MRITRHVPPPVIGNPFLLITHEAANKLLNERINLAKELVDKKVNSEIEGDDLKKAIDRWHDYNKDMLARIFTTEKMLNDYKEARMGAGNTDYDWHDWLLVDLELVRERSNKLLAIKERLELTPAVAPPGNQISAGKPKAPGANRKVFIVHGHDDGAKNTVARCLETLDLEPVILHEQANMGKTIIEKIEAHSDVGFAVVVLTPDDFGYAKSEPDKGLDRARQNVILELGYFLARLGRPHVCVLYVSGVELPSDYNGVLYTALDSGGNWKYALAKEIKAVGISVDLNKL